MDVDIIAKTVTLPSGNLGWLVYVRVSFAWSVSGLIVSFSWDSGGTSPFDLHFPAHADLRGLHKRDIPPPMQQL